MMRTRNRHGACLPLTLCTLVLLVTMSAIIGIIGTVLYVSEKNAEATYKPTMCFVTNYTLIQQTCSKRSCTGTGIFRTCKTDYYPCNKQSYRVTYNVSSGDILETTLNATDGPGPNSVLSCPNIILYYCINI